MICLFDYLCVEFVCLFARNSYIYLFLCLVPRNIFHFITIFVLMCFFVCSYLYFRSKWNSTITLATHIGVCACTRAQHVNSGEVCETYTHTHIYIYIYIYSASWSELVGLGWLSWFGLVGLAGLAWLVGLSWLGLVGWAWLVGLSWLGLVG